MTDPDAIGVALRVAAAIEGVGGTYFVGGSVASSLQGEPRATNDIDIVLEIPLGSIDAFVGALGADFEVDRDMLRDALLHGRSCNIFYLPVLSEKQWRDVVEVLRVSHAELDVSYLNAWATRLGLTTLLAKARSEV